MFIQILNTNKSVFQNFIVVQNLNKNLQKIWITIKFDLKFYVGVQFLSTALERVTTDLLWSWRSVASQAAWSRPPHPLRWCSPSCHHTCGQQRCRAPGDTWSHRHCRDLSNSVNYTPLTTMLPLTGATLHNMAPCIHGAISSLKSHLTI